MTEWFEEWFGEEYLQLYPHRDEADAARLIALLAGTLPWQPRWRVLDVGCGAGRHLAAIAARGAVAVGIDLSLALLRRVADVTDCPIVRADMRALPVRSRSMDLTVNLFTSFGYFRDDLEHAATLSGMLDTVRPGGWFAIDFLNADQVRAGLVPNDRLVLKNVTADVTRRLTPDGQFVTKTIRTPDGREYLERVRLFSAAELESMIVAGGGTVQHRFGDYSGGPLGPGPRTILLARLAA